MRVSKVVHKDVDQPFPWMRPIEFELSELNSPFLSHGFDDSTLRIVAVAYFETYFIGRLLVVEGLDDEGACVMDESCAGGPKIVIEEGTELVVNEFRNIYFVEGDVVFHDS